MSRMIVRNGRLLDPSQDLEGDFQYYLGSRFARAWFAENKHWLSPQLVELIERQIDLQPAENKPSYTESLRSRIGANEGSRGE